MLGEPATLAWHTSLLNKLLDEHKLKLLDWSLPPGRGGWRLPLERRSNRLKLGPAEASMPLS